ncbi:MAG: hypothetical protein LBI92_06740 [Azoarcus sp.]|jgi:hypothetical protein|nr:hypothetical protein [Azoarcus sp.]
MTPKAPNQVDALASRLLAFIETEAPDETAEVIADALLLALMRWMTPFGYALFISSRGFPMPNSKS